MEINAQQVESLLNLQAPQTRLGRKETVPAPGFEKILSQQMAQKDGGIEKLENADAMQAAMLSQIKLDSAGQVEQSADVAALQAAFDEASGALDMWDQYARTLGGSNSDSALRDAYNILQGLDSRLASLRANPAIEENADFEGLVNELAILSTTEKFKFNRGDYLS